MVEEEDICGTFLSMCLSLGSLCADGEQREANTVATLKLSLVVWCQLMGYNINLFFFPLCVIGMGFSSTSRTIHGLIFICKNK